MIRLHLLGALELAASDGRDLHPLVAQPKRLAVLAYLAARPAGEFVRRDTLLGVFWPELDQAAARRSLRQTLHVLRTHLGADALATRGDEDVAVNGAAVACDVPQFLTAVAERREAEALDLYRGDLLTGFFLSGAGVGFDRWLEDERTRLRQRAVGAATALAEAAERASDVAAAATWARRALALTPDDEVALRRLLTLLDRAGDRAAALRAYDAFARRLAQDLEEQPSPETRRLVARLRVSEPGAAAVPAPTAPPVARSARRWIPLAAAVVALAGGGAVLYAGHAPPPVIAVGEIAGGDSAVPQLAVHALPELLATDLARIEGLSVISHPRLEELAAQLTTRSGGAASIAVARAAGATEILEGALYRIGPDSLRLDLRRVDVRRGVVRSAVTLTGSNVFALADSAAADFAARFDLAVPARALTDVTSASLVAHELYTAGLHTYYATGDYRAAARLFQAALDQDSTFAMAAYYLGRSLEALDPSAGGAAYAQAFRLASHATDAEALLIRVKWSAAQNDPSWIPLAESLGARYPHEPESRYDEGVARLRAADFAGAALALRAAIALDSLSLTAPAARCVACDAYEALVLSEIAADSIATAARDAREWLRRQPHSSRAWEVWSDVLERQERLPEAAATRDSANRLRTGGSPTAVDRAYFLVRAGDYAAADRLLEVSEQTATGDLRRDAMWWHVISLRYQGRPAAAAVAARRFLLAGSPGPDSSRELLPLGQALLELGDFVGAAAAFDSAGTHSAAFRRDYPGLAARHRAWALAQRANVAAAQHDTAALRTLGDSIARYAQASAFGRDWHLVPYVRGLLLVREGHVEAAADSFRAAISSPTEGYTRTNIELARALLTLGRPREGLPWLQAALRGGMQASNYFATRPEIHEMLARCFAAAGQTDSARAHYAVVVRAWEHAEPAYHARWEAARAYLARTP